MERVIVGMKLVVVLTLKMVNREEPSDHLHLESSHTQEDHIEDHDRMHNMVTVAFRETISVVAT